jgi:hypothetical protein
LWSGSRCRPWGQAPIPHLHKNYYMLFLPIITNVWKSYPIKWSIYKSTIIIIF